MTNEQTEIREKARELALENLRTENLTNLASAYLVNESGLYGEAGDSAVEQFKYFPSLSSGIKAKDESGEEYDVLQSALLSSRQGKKRYSGNISEHGIMQHCAGIMQKNLDNIKIGDLYSLMGAEVSVKESMKDVYIGDLMPKLSEEEVEKLSPQKKKVLQKKMEIYKTLVNTYQSYLADKSVSESLAEKVKLAPKSLEGIVTEPKQE